MKTDIWNFLEKEPRWAKETKALFEWSLNCEGEPFRKFLDLIGYSDENFGKSVGDWSEPSKNLGYLELSYLADALNEYADNPHEIFKYIDELFEAESND